MSAQTGSAPPSGPVSQRFVDRARYRVDRLENDPNPVWIRELRQAARLFRTPIILMVFVVLMTLLVASIGGLISAEYSPAAVGGILFQVYFSMAYFIVTLFGPAVAANSIASEREGRTWEAVVLTGLPPATIARGKFLASFTAIGSYIVMLAPVGALSFLFGGVTATEVIVAFVFLFLIALLSVAFGLALSSKMETVRTAIVVTLLLSFPISILSFFVFGVGLSYAAHYAWPGVPEGYPVWLPIAYERAPLGLEYGVYLFVAPVVAVTLPAWFLYEVTVASLTSVTDDRSNGLKRWFLVTTPILTVAAAAPALASGVSSKTLAIAFAGYACFYFYLLFAVFLFQGDPVGPSQRVLFDWRKALAGRFRRFLGPGVMRSVKLLLLGGYTSLALLTAGSVLAIGIHTPKTELAQLAAVAGYAFAFYTFVVGLAAALRSGAGTAMTSRVLLFAILFGIALGPWIIAAVAGIFAERSMQAFAIAAPSPFYVVMMVEALSKGDSGLIVPAGVACAIAWAGLGFILMGVAQRRCRTIIKKHEATLVETERLLAAEDAAMHQARQAPAAQANAPLPGSEVEPASPSPSRPAAAFEESVPSLAEATGPAAEPGPPTNRTP